MTRTVAALYQSRAEAEFARARLLSETGARSPRIIGKDTAAAVDGLGLSPKDAESYRKGVGQGGHLLVAQVPRGRSSKRLVQLLKEAIGRADEAPDVRVPDGGGIKVDIPTEPDPATRRLPAQDTKQETTASRGDNRDSAIAAPGGRDLHPEPQGAKRAPEEVRTIAEERIPIVQEELTVEKREVPRGGARMRAFTRETPAEAEVDLREETVEVESRPSGRRMNDAEVEPAGVFTNRVFEFTETREEPVITKEAFVREELIIRKRVDQRTETVRDTVRHTEVEVEDLAAGDADAPAFFGHGSGSPRG